MSVERYLFLKGKGLGDVDPALPGQYGFLNTEKAKATQANDLLSKFTTILQTADLNLIGTEGKQLYAQLSNLANGSGNVDVQKAFSSATSLVSTVGGALKPYSDAATKAQTNPSALPASEPNTSAPTNSMTNLLTPQNMALAVKWVNFETGKNYGGIEPIIQDFLSGQISPSQQQKILSDGVQVVNMALNTNYQNYNQVAVDLNSGKISPNDVAIISKKADEVILNPRLLQNTYVPSATITTTNVVNNKPMTTPGEYVFRGFVLGTIIGTTLGWVGHMFLAKKPKVSTKKSK